MGRSSADTVGDRGRSKASCARAQRTLTALLLASVCLGGECQEYLDEKAAAEAEQLRLQTAQEREARQGRRQQDTRRRQRLSVELQSHATRLQRATERYTQAFQQARNRLRPMASDRHCVKGTPSEESLHSLIFAGSGAPPPPLPPPELSVEVESMERLARQLAEALPEPADRADEQQIAARMAPIEEAGRRQVAAASQWVYTVVVRSRVPAKLKPIDGGMRYEPGHIEGTAFLYSLDAAAFLCMGTFRAESSADLKLETSRPERRPHYDSRRRRTEYTTHHERVPMAQSDAEKVLRQDLADQTWRAVGSSLRYAELTPEPSPPQRGRKAGSRRPSTP